MSDARTKQVEDLVEPIVAGHGADLEFVTIRAAGRRTVVVIAVDADGGVQLEDIAEYSREISEALDESGVMGESPYTLEVTSPGVHRPLTLPRHWRRAQGRLVRIQMTDGSTVTGRIVSGGERAAIVQEGDHQREVAFDDVLKAVVQVEFEPGGQ